MYQGTRTWRHRVQTFAFLTVLPVLVTGAKLSPIDVVARSDVCNTSELASLRIGNACPAQDPFLMQEVPPYSYLQENDTAISEVIVNCAGTLSNEEAIYEIRPSPNKGLGVFAKSFIPRGTLIMAEAPLFSVELPPVPPRQGHTVEQILSPISAAVESLTPQGRLIFEDCFEYIFPEELEEDMARRGTRSAAHHEHHHHQTSDNKIQHHGHDTHSAAEPAGDAQELLHDSQEMALRHLRIFRTNAYLTPSLSSPSESYIYTAPTIPAMFPKIARINHSCAPNAYGSWNPAHRKRVIRASRDIQPGEEVLVTYIPLLKGTEERRGALEQYGFRCDCEVCRASDGDKGRKEDIVRRRLGRELQEIKGGWENRDGLSVFQQKRFAKQAGKLAESLRGHDSVLLRENGKGNSKEEGGEGEWKQTGGELWEYLEQVYDMAASFSRETGDMAGADRWADLAVDMRRL